MKKRDKAVRKGNHLFHGLDNNLKWGFKGLQYSFIFLIVLIVILFVVAFVTSQNSSELNSMVFKVPQGSDYLGIFSGVILFIAVPFLIGIKLGMNVNKI